MKPLFPLLAIALGAPAFAQGPNPKPPVFGVHYSFERLSTIRMVKDAHDNGPVRLMSHVYRPLRNKSGEVVVALHGSTGGMAIAPAEPYLGDGLPLWFLLERGYTVVVPMRRGRAESGGHYVEECAYQAGKCSLAEYRGLTNTGLADALASTEAVIHQSVVPLVKPKSDKVLLWGSSRGALLALHYAAAHPREVRGVVAVSPGWLSMTDKWSAEENRARLDLQKSILSRSANGYKGPTLWVYADGDPFFSEAVTRQLFAAYSDAGGSGKYVQVRGHKLRTGHVPPVDLWQADADNFLRALPK